MVCLSVVHDHGPCKYGCTDQDAIWGQTLAGQTLADLRNNVLDGSAHWHHL